MKRSKILIADDNMHMRLALRKRLRGWGYQVFESRDGFGVFNLICRENLDVIILDHEMPLGDGQSVARVIRQECDAPIIFLSGHDRALFDNTLAALENVHYLSKPLDAERLEQLLAACVCPTVSN